MFSDQNAQGNAAAAPAVKPARVILEFNPATGHLSITGDMPANEVGLEMCRRAEYEFMKLIEAAKKPRLDRVGGHVLEMLDRARQKGGNQA